MFGLGRGSDEPRMSADEAARLVSEWGPTAPPGVVDNLAGLVRERERRRFRRRVR